MHPTDSLVHMLAARFEEDRHRDEERRFALHRALLDMRADHPSSRTTLRHALLNLVRRDDHSLTDYPCRLPNGKIGLVAVIQQDGDWTLVCRVA